MCAVAKYSYLSEIGEKLSAQEAPLGKSVSVSFRVRVVRASGRGEAAWACEGETPWMEAPSSSTTTKGKLSADPF